MNATTPSRSRKLPLFLTIAGTMALIAGGLTLFSVLTRQKQLSIMPNGVSAIPQEALMVASFSTEANQWQQVNSFGTLRSQALVGQALGQLHQRFLGSKGLDYERDIQPWIGKEVTLALLSPQAGIANPTEPSMVANPQPAILVVPIADPLKAKEVLEKSAAARTQWVERKYKGIQIRQGNGNGKESVSIALLDPQNLVIATTPKAIDRAIDTHQGDTALDKTPGYADALTQIKAEQPLARFYFNIPAMAKLSIENSSRPLPPQTLSQIQENQGVAAAATLAPEGMQFKAISWLRPDSQRHFDARNTAKLMPNRLPAETLVMASGGNLQQFWQDYSRGVAANPVRVVNPEALKQGIQTTLGLDLEQDLLKWMQGEFSLAALPSPANQANSMPISLVLMIQASDRRAAENAFKKLDQVMASKYTFGVSPGKVAGQPVVNWAIPGAGFNVTRGWMDGDVAFLALGGGVVQSFVPKPNQALAETNLFRQSMTAALTQNNGHFFINTDRVLSLKSFPLLQLPILNRTVLEAMTSIGVTSATTSDRTTRYDIFVGLKKEKKVSQRPVLSLSGTTANSGL